MTHRELDPQKDTVLARLPSKADSFGHQLQQVFALTDILCDKIPFEKSMFYSMRTALQDDAARLYAPEMVGATFRVASAGSPLDGSFRDGGFRDGFRGATPDVSVGSFDPRSFDGRRRN